MAHRCIPTCLPRCDIRALESFTTVRLVAEIDRRCQIPQSNAEVGYSRLDRSHLMTPEFFHKKMEQIVNLSALAFSTRVSLYREPENNNPVSDAINKIIDNDCCKYRNIMNNVLSDSLPEYTVLGDPVVVYSFLRHQEREMGALEESYSKETVAAIEAVSATRNTPAPDEVAPENTSVPDDVAPRDC